MNSLEQCAHIIQRSWNMRRNRIAAMMCLVEELYNRYESAWKAFDLVDVWLDDTIDDAILTYDHRATRLFTISFKDYQALRVVPD